MTASQYVTTKIIRCAQCKKKIITGNKRKLTRHAERGAFCSLECANLFSRKTAWPPSSVLAALVRYLPVTKLAATLHVSDVAVKKHCLKVGIDVPPRGFWAKVHAGKAKPGYKPGM